MRLGYLAATLGLSALAARCPLDPVAAEDSEMMGCPASSTPGIGTYRGGGSVIERKNMGKALGLVCMMACLCTLPGADALGRRLQSLGFDAYVTDGISGGEVWYRVRVRPAFGEGPAELSSTLRDHGYKVWVTDE